jgi:hypothetical protein
MNKIQLIIGALLITVSSFGQETTKVIHSVETSFELGLGGALYGLQVKANHHWQEKGRWTVLSGVSYSTFWSSVNTYTQYFPTLAEEADITGFTTDNHLRAYTGVRWALFKKCNFILSAEGYLGGYNAYMNGNYSHERLQVDQDYTASQFFFDYGTRLGMTVKVNDKLQIQATINNSLRQMGFGYKFLPTIYQYNPDNKMSLGIGAVWNLK